MSWDYRVIRRKLPSGEVSLGIHEVYLDANGLIWAVTEDPVAPRVSESEGEGAKELSECLTWMKDALRHPILDLESIPETGAVSPLEDLDLGDLEEFELFGESLDD